MIQLTKYLVLLSLVFQLVSPSVALWAVEQTPATSAEIEDFQFIKNLYRDKHYSHARDETIRFRQKYPGSHYLAEVIFLQAQTDVVEERFTEALKRYDSIVVTFPKSPFVQDALYYSGTLLIQLGSVEQGVERLRLLRQMYPASSYIPMTDFHLGQIAFKQKEWITAETYFRAALRTEGLSEKQRLDIQYSLAWTHYFQGKAILAKSLFLELLESPIDLERKAAISFQLAVEAQKKGDYQKALRWFDRQMTQWPHPEYQDRSRFWIAELIFRQVREEPERWPDKTIQKSLDYFTRNINLKSPVEIETSRYHRGILYSILRQDSEAEKDYKWLQEHNATFAADINLTAVRGDYYEKRKDLKKANAVYINCLNKQKGVDNRNPLLVRIIRNDYQTKDCSSVLHWIKRVDSARDPQLLTEMLFYAGKCDVALKNWKSAIKAFSKIQLNSDYGPLIFNEYLLSLRKTNNLRGGLALLDKAKAYPAFGGAVALLNKRSQFCLRLKEWPEALRSMKKLRAIDPRSGKDPWFFLRMAKTTDRLLQSMNNKKWRRKHRSLKPKRFYARQALFFYETAFKLLPEKERNTRLNVLNILSRRYEKAGEYTRQISAYKAALKLVKSNRKRDELQLKIAVIYIGHLKAPNKARYWLLKLHGKGDRDVNYKASTILAEVYVEKNRYDDAINVLKKVAARPIARSKWYPIVHFRLGELYQARENWKNAIRHYQMVVNRKRRSKQNKEAKRRIATIRKYLKGT